MKKRIISFLMALVMAVSLLPVQVFAASSPTVVGGKLKQSIEYVISYDDDENAIFTPAKEGDEASGCVYIIEVPSTETDTLTFTLTGNNTFDTTDFDPSFMSGIGEDFDYQTEGITLSEDKRSIEVSLKNAPFPDSEAISQNLPIFSEWDQFNGIYNKKLHYIFAYLDDGDYIDILIYTGGNGKMDAEAILATTPIGTCTVDLTGDGAETYPLRFKKVGADVSALTAADNEWSFYDTATTAELSRNFAEAARNDTFFKACVKAYNDNKAGIETDTVLSNDADHLLMYAYNSSTEDYYMLLLEWEKGVELTDEQKKPLADLLDTVTGENEQNWYQSGDRWNGKTASKTGFWAEFTAANGPRAKAQKVLETAATEEQITAAVAALQAAIANLIPTSQLNPTKLYEAVQQYKSYTDEWFENFTENSIVRFKAKLAEAEEYLNSLFGDNGDPTAKNVPENQSTADSYLKAVSATLVNKEDLAKEQDNVKIVNALLKQCPTANNGVYTEESWNAFVAARDAAKEYFTQYPVTEAGFVSAPSPRQHSKLAKQLVNAIQSLTPAAEQITVTLTYTDDYHLRVPDSKKTDPAGNKPGTQKVTLTSGATIGDLMNQTGYTYKEGGDSNNFEGVHLSQDQLLCNGCLLITSSSISGSPATKSMDKTGYVLRDGDVIQLVHMDWPSFEFNYIYRDSPSWVALGNQLKAMRFAGASAQTAKTGEETTVTVEATSAHLWTYNGIYSAYAGAEIAVYGPRNEDGTYPEKAILTGKLTDAAGQASFKLYNEGVYLVTAFESHANDSNSGYYPSAVVAAPYLELTVTANEDGAGIKADLKAELDKVYKTYPESYFRPETWEKLKAAYDKAAEILTSTDSAVSAAYDAQKSAISEIKGYQAATTAENEKTLTNFRTALDKLPDNTSLITAGVKSTVDELISCYEGMSDYQRKQLTGAEKAKYDKIKAFAAANETFPADNQYSLKLNVVADTPAATAALNEMVTYLREHPAKMDRAEGGKYDHTKAINIVTPYTFGRYDGSTMLFSKTFSKIEPLTPVRLYTAIDYAAYFQTRNANGTFTVDKAKWSISDEGLGIVTLVEGHAQTPGVYGTTGHLTVTVDGVVYEVKSITYEGLAKSDVTVGTQRVYDDSGYKGKSTDVVNVDISEAYLGFTMPYNDVTVTITWAPVGDTLSTVRQAAQSRLQELRSSLGDKADEAYQAGVKAIAAAKTVAAVDKAYQAAVKDMQSAAASYGKVRVIVENKTFPKADWGKDTYWYGEAADEEIPLTANSTMMSCVVEALTRNHFTQTGAESNYISSISDPTGFKLAEFDGGGGSGWMGSLNDWFNNEGFGEFTVANGKLQDGDVIRIMYTRDLGVDLDGTWGNSDTTLQALKVQGGELMGEFTPGEPGGSYEYVLAINGAGSVQLTPTAANKNYLTKMFLNEKVTSDVEGVSFYKRTQSIPVKDGDVIYIGCGEKAWPSMNKQGAEAREYTGTWYALRVVDVNKGASTVESMIDELPEVSSVKYGNYQLYMNAVAAARASFDALNSKQQKSVDAKKLAELEKLEAAIAQFQAIDEVKDKLDKLPSAGDLTIEDQEAVKAAKEAYDKLSDEQKAELTGLEIDKMGELTTRMDEIVKDNSKPNPGKPGNGGNNSSAKNPYQKDNGKDVKSGNTGDAGVTLYVGMGLVAVLAGAVIITRKRKEN